MKKPFTVGKTDDRRFKRQRFATMGEAEQHITTLEGTDPAGVHAGDYYIDGPEELINPPKPKTSERLHTVSIGDWNDDVLRYLEASLNTRFAPLAVTFELRENENGALEIWTQHTRRRLPQDAELLVVRYVEGFLEGFSFAANHTR